MIALVIAIVLASAFLCVWIFAVVSVVITGTETIVKYNKKLNTRDSLRSRGVRNV